MSAFANQRGGRLLVGVNDNRTISGVKSEDEEHMLGLAAHFYCKPELEVKIIEWQIEKKIVLGSPAKVWRDVPVDQLLDNQ